MLCTAPSRASAGSHFGAGIVVWHGAALLRDYTTTLMWFWLLCWQDTERSLALSAEYEGTILDYSRMNVSIEYCRLLRFEVGSFFFFFFFCRGRDHFGCLYLYTSPVH